jgi:phosphoenolpyruvate carboxykinase (GTP)
MLPFCGFNMGDYFAHWLSIGQRAVMRPRIFHVNWFRRDDRGKFLWPGFGENIRVLQWILDRVDGTGGAESTIIGNVPSQGAIDLQGLDIGARRFQQLVAVDPRAWLEEAERNGSFLEKFGTRLPKAIRSEHRSLIARIHNATR